MQSATQQSGESKDKFFVLAEALDVPSFRAAELLEENGGDADAASSYMLRVLGLRMDDEAENDDAMASSIMVLIIHHGFRALSLASAAPRLDHAGRAARGLGGVIYPPWRYDAARIGGPVGALGVIHGHG